MRRGTTRAKRLLATAALCAGLAVARPALPADGAPVNDDPWIFVVHDGDTFDTADELELLARDAVDKLPVVGESGAGPKAKADAINKRIRAVRNDLEDYKQFVHMADRQYWASNPEGAIPGSIFWKWIARHQRAWDDHDGCFGKPLKKETMRTSETILRSAFRWYLGKNYGDESLHYRPHGPRVRYTSDGVKRLDGEANYVTCKDEGFMETTTVGQVTANRISVGPQTNALLKYLPNFHLSAAHELGHVIQYNHAPLKQSNNATYRYSKNGSWIIEGAADAGAIMYTRDALNKVYFGPYANKYYRRFFLSRAYNIPLNYPHKEQSWRKVGSPGPLQASLLAEIEKKTLDNLYYQTNGFWFHVIERYLKGDPRKLNKLYDSMTGPAVTRNATRLVDRWLDSLDEGLDGLEHVLPQFLTEYASWSDHRFGGAMSEKKWLDLGFGGCRKLDLTSTLDPSASVTLDLAEYAGDCIRVVLNPTAAAALRPDLQIRIDEPVDILDQVDMIDEVYLGWAKGGTFKGAHDCYEVASDVDEYPGKIAPCLLTPEDGLKHEHYQRYLYLPEVEDEMIFVVSWVPQKIEDAHRDFRVTKVKVTVSLDRASMSTGANDTTERKGGKRATTDYSGKHGRAPVTAESDKPAAEATPRDVFTGNFATLPAQVPPQIAQALDRQKDASITVRADTDDNIPSNEAPAVTFIFREPLEPGDAGPLKVYALSSGDNRTGLQNPDRESRLVIDTYDDDTLSFHGTAHVCEGDLTTASMAGVDKPLCEIFPPRTYEVSGAIAFPTVRNSVARLKQPPISDAYRKYQDLRLGRLEQRLGTPGLLVPRPEAGGGPGGGAGWGRHTKGDCDCSCNSQDRSDETLQCRLLCGKIWAQCPKGIREKLKDFEERNEIASPGR